MLRVQLSSWRRLLRRRGSSDQMLRRLRLFAAAAALLAAVVAASALVPAAVAAVVAASAAVFAPAADVWAAVAVLATPAMEVATSVLSRLLMSSVHQRLWLGAVTCSLTHSLQRQLLRRYRSLHYRHQRRSTSRTMFLEVRLLIGPLGSRQRSG